MAFMVLAAQQGYQPGFGGLPPYDYKAPLKNDAPQTLVSNPGFAE